MEETVTLDVKIQMVKRQKVFSQLAATEIDELAALFQEKHYNPGDTIVAEGDIVDSILLIMSGRADVRILVLTETPPKIRSLALLGPNQAIGINETGFYSLTGRRTASVVALTPMVTLFLSLPRFHGFALAYPHVNEVMRGLASRVLNPLQ